MEEQQQTSHHVNNSQYPYNLDPRKVTTLLAWKAPGRPFRKRHKSYYASTLLIMLLIEIILFLFSQYVLMLTVLSLVFVAFALASVPPHDFRYKVTTEGITVEDHFYLWNELQEFYFKKRHDMTLLHIRTEAMMPGEITLTLPIDITEDHVRSVLLPFLPYREFIKPTFTEKAGTWLAKNFPLEKTDKEQKQSASQVAS